MSVGAETFPQEGGEGGGGGTWEERERKESLLQPPQQLSVLQRPTLLRATGACDGFNTEQQNGEGSSCSAADSSSSPLSPLLCHLSSAASSVNSQGSDRNEATALCFYGFAHKNVA